jgi:hypothetical protein
MDRIDEINQVLISKGKLVRGDILNRICQRANITRQTLNEKRRRKSEIRDSEMKIILEELKLPLEG